KRRLVLMLRDVEHRDVAVRVTGGQERPAAGTTPDPDWLLRAVVEIVGLCLVRDRATTLVARVIQRGCASDHALPRNAVDLLADRPHEVTTAARRDVVREAVRLQIAEQLDHRRIRRFEISAPEGRMLRRTQESVR